MQPLRAWRPPSLAWHGTRVRPWPSRCRRSSPRRRSRPEPHRRHAACIARHRAEARTAYDVGRRDPMATLLHAPLTPRCRPAFPSGRASLIGHHCAGSNALRRHRARLRGCSRQRAKREKMSAPPPASSPPGPLVCDDWADANSTISTSEEEEDIAMFELK